MEFNEVDAKLRHKTTGAKLDRRKIQNNTWLERRDDGTIALKVHDTDVVTFYRDGKIALRSGGWYTKLTSQRIDEYAHPFCVGTIDGRWHVSYRNPKRDENDWRTYRVTVGEFYEGIVLDLTRPLDYEMPVSVFMARKYDDEVLNLVSKYIRGLTPNVWKEMIEGDNPGDCFYCATNLKTVGSTHIIEHVKEKRYSSSLICNALRECDVYNEDRWDRYPLKMIKTMLRRYFKAHLLTGNYGGRRPTAAYHKGGFY